MKIGFGWLSPSLSLYASLPKHVHIWRASLICPQLLSLSSQILTDEEKKMATSIGSFKVSRCTTSSLTYFWRPKQCLTHDSTYLPRNSQQQRRFKATRACLRDVLSRYVQQTRPQDVRFSRTEKGKPVMVCPSSDLQFNLAHTGNVLLIAVALTEVGVDIERRDRPLHNITALLRSRLSRLESMCIQNLSEEISPDDREDFIRKEFLKTWTRKEAFVKSTGDGIAKGLHGIEIIERAARLVVQDISSGTSLSKTGLRDFSPDSAHFGAVALASDEPYEVVLFQYRTTLLQA